MSRKSIKPQYIDKRYWKYFRVALSVVLADPTQLLKASTLCRKIGISHSSLTGFLHPNPARRLYPSFQMQIAIAKGLGYDYLEFMAFGKSLVEPVARANYVAPRTRKMLDRTKYILESKTTHAQTFYDIINTYYQVIIQPPNITGKNKGGGAQLTPFKATARQQQQALDRQLQALEKQVGKQKPRWVEPRWVEWVDHN